MKDEEINGDRCEMAGTKTTEVCNRVSIERSSHAAIDTIRGR